MERITKIKNDGRYTWNDDDFRQEVNKQLGTNYPSGKALKSAYNRFRKLTKESVDSGMQGGAADDASQTSIEQQTQPNNSGSDAAQNNNTSGPTRDNVAQPTNKFYGVSCSVSTSEQIAEMKETIQSEKNRANSALGELIKSRADLLQLSTSVGNTVNLLLDALRVSATEKVRADWAEAELAKVKADLVSTIDLQRGAQNDATKAADTEKVRADKAESELKEVKGNLDAAIILQKVANENLKRAMDLYEEDHSRFHKTLRKLAKTTQSNTSKEVDFTDKYRRLAEEFETTKRGMKDEINSDD